MEKWSQTYKKFLKKSFHKGTYPFPHCNDKDRSNRFKTHQNLFFWIFNNMCHILECILLIFKNYLFFKITFMASLNILCSDPDNVLKGIIKKLGKYIKAFCYSPSKILKIFHGSSIFA